jgi:SOS-response transcriptional repressor LexA
MPRIRRSSDIGERLRAAIEAKGMRHGWVASEAGITPATLSNILTSRTSDPSLSVVKAIADVIGEPLGALLGDRSESLLESEQEVLRQAVEILERRVLRSRLDSFSRTASTRESLDEADALPRHAIPTAIHRRGARMVFRTIGDSMAEEGIRNGDVLYVKPISDVRSVIGRIIVCRFDGSLFVRKLTATGRGIRLQTGSGSYLIVTDTAAFEILGVVIAHLGEL